MKKTSEESTGTWLSIRLTKEERQKMQQKINENKNLHGVDLSVSELVRSTLRKAGVIALAFALTSCGKIPTGRDAAPNSGGNGTERSVSRITCESTTTFLDVNKVKYETLYDRNGNKIVTCTVWSTAGIEYSSTDDYQTGDPSNKYFGQCRIYYKNSYWLTFVTPGYYNPGQEGPNPAIDGWKISGMPEYPSDGLSFNATTCDEE